LQATNHVTCGLKPNVSETISAYIIRGKVKDATPLMMEAEMVSEILVFIPQLTQLVV
jgi:hypothetical protein